MRLTKTWSPMSSVFSIELEGISKACTTNVMMNRPVTRTAQSEARYSAVVSFGLSSADFFSKLPSLFATGVLSTVLIARATLFSVPVGGSGSSGCSGTDESRHRQHGTLCRREHPDRGFLSTSKSAAAGQLYFRVVQIP